MTLRRFTAPAVVAALLTVVMTACGGSSSPVASQTSSSASSSTPSAAGTAPADPSAAKAQITTTWEKFFDYTTPEAQATALLENGSSLGAALRLAKQERAQTHLRQKAQVKVITFTSPTQASVTYVLLNGTTPLLNNASGVAVYVDGSWKVSTQTFCSLVTLGNNGKAPAGC
jgi:hypothetical protein